MAKGKRKLYGKRRIPRAKARGLKQNKLALSIFNRFRPRGVPQSLKLISKAGTYDAGTDVAKFFRGIAAGDIHNPDVSKGNIRKWRFLTNEEVEEFILDGKRLPVHSSNVRAAVYLIEFNQLVITYKDGSKYGYGNISEEKALEFAAAPSKGSWVWSNLRVRGSKTAHRKPYWRIGGSIVGGTVIDD